jgi:MFS transporter, DHA2 family, multidrug resistance protein
MNAIPREEMGNATSIFNLMRNIGGSIGIATAATLLERNRQIHTNILGAHITPYDSQTQQILNKTSSALIANGVDPVTAAHRAQGMIFGVVQRHATMLAFIDVLRLFGIMFILIVPLIWLAKPPHTKKQEPEAINSNNLKSEA